LRIAYAVLRPGFLYVIGALALGQFVAPPLDQVAHVRRAQALSATVAVQSERGFWSRDGLRFVRVRDIRDKGVVGEVEIYEFDDDGRLRLFTRAPRAEVLARHTWVLSDVVQKEFGADGIERRRLPTLRWESFLSQEQVALLTLPPYTLAFSDLYRYVRYLRASGQDAASYELALWQKTSMPLATGAMVLLAIPFVFGLLRVASAGQRMMVGSLVGIAFHLTSQIIARLGLLLNLNPAVTALAPVALVLAVAVWLFRRGY
jgi:lipopolysaccharide export system permease protein